MKMSKEQFSAVLQGMFNTVIAKVQIDSKLKMNLMRLMPIWISVNYKAFAGMDSDFFRWHQVLMAGSAIVEMMYGKELMQTKNVQELTTVYQDKLWFGVLGIQRTPEEVEACELVGPFVIQNHMGLLQEHVKKIGLA